MSFIHDFPYTNFHEMNLDWILKQIINVNEELENLKKNRNSLDIKTSKDIDLIPNNPAEAANNTLKIETALNEGNIVIIGIGLFYCDEITVKAGNYIFGINRNKSILKFSHSNGIIISLDLDSMNYDTAGSKIWCNVGVSNLSIISDTLNGIGLYCKNYTFEDAAHGDINEYQRIVGHLYGFELRNSIISNLYINGFNDGVRLGGFVNTALIDSLFIEHCIIGCNVYGSDSKFTNSNITFCKYGFNLSGPFNYLNNLKIYMIGTGTLSQTGSYGINIGSAGYGSSLTGIDIQECGEIGCYIKDVNSITLDLNVDSCGYNGGDTSTGLYIENCNNIIGTVKATNLRSCQKYGIALANVFNININYSEIGQLMPLSNIYARLLNTPKSTETVYQGSSAIGHCEADYAHIYLNAYFTLQNELPAGTPLASIDLIENKSFQMVVPGSNGLFYTIYGDGKLLKCFQTIPSNTSIFINNVSPFTGN